MIRLFDFLPAADADLREIIRYSRKQWGVAQTHTYVAALKHGIEELAKGEGFYKTLSEVHPELRIAHCGHHYIFCLNRSDAPAIIVAILHERMDMLARLKSRLVP